MSAAPILAPEPETRALTIRPVVESELPLVFDSWVKSYEKLMPLHAPGYGLGRYGWIDKCARWAVARSLVIVATPEDYEDVVLGWACAEPHESTVHYVFVKHAARRFGVASALLRQLNLPAHLKRPVLRITHRPGRQMRAIADARGMQYRPLTMEEISR